MGGGEATAHRDIGRSGKGTGPFPLPKLDQAAFEFWTFKPSAGDAPTTAAVALQLKALAPYEQWVSVLKEAQARGIGELPANTHE